MSPLLQIQYLIEYLILRLIIGFVRLFPLDTAANISAWCWQKIAPRTRRHRRALENLEKAYPEKTAEEREEIALKMWGNLGRVMAETMLLDRLLAEPERIEIIGHDIFERYKGKMGAAVGVCLHMGNWELAMWPLVQAEAPSAAVYRLVKNPYVDLYLRSMRKELYPGGMFAKGKSGSQNAGFDTARALGAYVRKGGRIGFLADLYDRKGIPVPFFGHPASSTPFPAMLARKLGTRMWISRCIRVGENSRFQVETKELKVPRTDDIKADIEWITAATQAQFEEWIRETPDQWMWSNRKWS